MNSTDPPHLGTIRTALLIVYVAGISVLFLPFVGRTSIGQSIAMLLSHPGNIAPRSWSSMTDLLLLAIWISLPLLFIIPLIIPALEAVCLFRDRLWRIISYLMVGFIWLVVFWTLILQSLAVILSVSQLSSGNSEYPDINVTMLLSAGAAFATLIIFEVIHFRRPRNRAALAYAALRWAFTFGTSILLIAYGLDTGLQSGAWVCVGLCVLFFCESIVLFSFSARGPSGAAYRPFLRYWLPSKEVIPPAEWNICVECGYDLRGTTVNTTGLRTCPECGAAV